MKFVIEDAFIYLCDDEKLPTNCYYCDVDNFRFVGKFDNIEIIITQSCMYSENISLPHNYYDKNETIETFYRGLHIANYDVGYIKTQSHAISVYMAFLYHIINREIRIMKSFILDAYIKYKPNTTKSAQK